VIPEPTYSFAVSAGAGGRVSGTPGGSYEAGTAVTVIATANSGYRFKNWTVSGVMLANAAANPATFVMPAGPVSVRANFELVNNDTGGGGVPPVDKDDDKQQTTKPPVPIKDIPAVKAPVTPGGSSALPPSITFDDGTSADVTWSSEDTGVAKVDAGGNLVAVSEGTVKLTARAANGKTQTITVVIAKPVTSIRTPLKSLYMKKGTSLAPPFCADSKTTTGKADTVAKLTYKSNNKKVATVDAKGKIKARKNGKAQITVTAVNGKKLTIKVTVVKKATALKKVSLTKPPKSLKRGKTAILKVKPTPAKATNLKVTFKSSKPKVLKVDKAGKLTALKKGKAKITVKIGKRKYVRTITVK
jgi:uncharacterized protein YjdB